MTRFLRATLVLALALPLMAMTPAEMMNLYNNQTVGIRLVKPASWQFASAEQHAATLENVKLKDSAVAGAMMQRAKSNIPLVIVAKYPEPYADLNPSLKVNVRPYPPELKAGGARLTIEQVLPGMGEALKDFKVVTPPTDTTISGIKAARAEFTYTLQTQSGAAIPTLSKLWLVPRGDYFFLIGVGLKPNDPATAAELQQIIDTIVIDQPEA